MSQGGETIEISAGASGHYTQLVRIEFRLDAKDIPSGVGLKLFAETTYIAWVNGRFLGRGPTYHHPECKPLDHYDLSADVQPGRNVVALVVHSPGISIHNAVPST